MAQREAAFNQGHLPFQLQESRDLKGAGGGDGVLHNLCHPLCRELGSRGCRAAPVGNTDPKEVANAARGHRDLAQRSDLI